jgi:hypothetical protein
MSEVTCNRCGTYRTNERHECGRIREAQQWVKCDKCETTHPRGLFIHAKFNVNTYDLMIMMSTRSLFHHSYFQSVPTTIFSCPH